ncbi:MAG: DinB family protein [Saprospiraceae bacterium]|nr:DinB family protein [Saprospiraceae bacterium]
MTMIELLTKEMEQEAVITRKMLERIPNDQFSWKPHEKNMTIERLANHIAELPGWIEMILNTEELDFENNPYLPTTYRSADLLTYFEKTLKSASNQLSKASENQLKDVWTLRQGKNILSQTSKLEMMRTTFCQIVHHRAQLGVYLRLLDIPIPGSYGPSADEQ